VTPAAVRWARPGRLQQVVLGDVVVTYVPDGFVELDPGAWFSRDDPNRVFRTHKELLGDAGMLVASVGVLLLEGPGWRLLVDAGLGPTRVPASDTHPALGAMHGGDLVDHRPRLRDVDAVVVTHWHDDHVGWARAGWPGFGNLREAPHLVGTGEPAPSHWGRVSDGDEVAPGVRVLATPGHTAGHVSLVVAGTEQRLVVLGDVMHSPVQVAQPHLGSCFELDAHESRRSRSRVLDELAVPGTLGAATHFADVPFGVVRGGRWEPSDGASMVVPPPG
jgi:glyoxylase-like metal-dependent hydrolase (beta-lactamase superfamily II)